MLGRALSWQYETTPALAALGWDAGRFADRPQVGTAPLALPVVVIAGLNSACVIIRKSGKRTSSIDGIRDDMKKAQLSPATAWRTIRRPKRSPEHIKAYAARRLELRLLR